MRRQDETLVMVQCMCLDILREGFTPDKGLFMVKKVSRYHWRMHWLFSHFGALRDYDYLSGFSRLLAR